MKPKKSRKCPAVAGPAQPVPGPTPQDIWDILCRAVRAELLRRGRELPDGQLELPLTVRLPLEAWLELAGGDASLRRLEERADAALLRAAAPEHLGEN